MIYCMLIMNMPLWIAVYLRNKWCLNLESWIYHAISRTEADIEKTKHFNTATKIDSIGPRKRRSFRSCFNVPNHIERHINTLRPRQNGRHFADDTFNRIFVLANARISIKFSLKFVPKGPINNIPALVQIMAWRRPSDKPLSEPMLVRLPTHICVTRPQWVNTANYISRC